MPWRTGPGYPIDTTSYFQSRAMFARLRPFVPESLLAGCKSPYSALSSGQDLDACAADIHNQHSHDKFGGLTDLSKGIRFRRYDRHQVIPGLGERSNGFLLKPGRQRIHIDAKFCKLFQKSLHSRRVGGRITSNSVWAARAFNVFSACVHCERCGKRLDIKNIGSFGSLFPAAHNRR